MHLQQCTKQSLIPERHPQQHAQSMPGQNICITTIMRMMNNSITPMLMAATVLEIDVGSSKSMLKFLNLASWLRVDNFLS